MNGDDQHDRSYINRVIITFGLLRWLLTTIDYYYYYFCEFALVNSARKSQRTVYKIAGCNKNARLVPLDKFTYPGRT